MSVRYVCDACGRDIEDGELKYTANVEAHVIQNKMMVKIKRKLQLSYCRECVQKNEATLSVKEMLGESADCPWK